MADYVIPANYQNGVNTFTLNPGQTAKVTASGEWLTNPHGSGGWCGAGGNGVPAHGAYPIPDPGGEGCLVWEIVDSTIITHNPTRGRFSTDNETLTLTQPGLYMWIANDDYNGYGDNQGSITIHVTIY